MFSRAMPIMPTMPLMGVRTSCDMRERNSDLAALAASASSVLRWSRRSWLSMHTSITQSVIPMFELGMEVK